MTLKTRVQEVLLKSGYACLGFMHPSS